MGDVEGDMWRDDTGLASCIPATGSTTGGPLGPNGGTHVPATVGVCLRPGWGTGFQEKNINEDW